MYTKMVTEMKVVEIIHREIVKPSSPTPQHLRTYKLCFLDQIAQLKHTPQIFFYPADNGHPDRRSDNNNNNTKKTEQLKKSLSETLTHFYPFAGRIRDNLYVECNDDGVEFVEAISNCSMSKFLEEVDTQLLGQLVAGEQVNIEASRLHLLLFQATFFRCGGMAIGICASHKVMDASTLSTFLHFWAATSFGSTDEVAVPVFNAASLLPPNEGFSDYSKPPFSSQGELRSRRFVFEPAKIASLQSKAASESVKNPTRVEAVSALLWKLAIEASRTTNNDPLRPSVLFQPVNIRPLVVPPWPASLVGNILGASLVKIEESDRIDLQSLVAKMRKANEQVKVNYGKGLLVEEMQRGAKEKELRKQKNKNNEDYYICTSLCRLPFYKVDFGWGKPIWWTYCRKSIKNTIALMSTKDEKGIQVWLSLSKEDMSLLECNQELLAFAALDPSIGLHFTPKL